MEHTQIKSVTSGISKTTDGVHDCFTIVLPAGELQVKHLTSYLDLLTQLNPADVLKTSISIFFTAINDDSLTLTSEQKLHIEKSMLSLVDHLDVKLCKLH
jgi:hypothetical protein